MESLSGGLLSGKYSREQKDVEGSRRTAFDFPPVDIDRAYNVIRVQRHRRVEGAGRLKTRFCCATRHRVALAPEPRHERHSWSKADRAVERQLGAVDVALSGEELRSLDQVSQLPAEYPGWMLNMWSQTRAKQLEDSRT